jgi:hypothetical protein
VDLEPLKPFVRNMGTQGPYYEMKCRLEIVFGPEIVFKIVQDGRVVGSVATKYT